MATYVLVHGGWCASWCWEFNVKALTKKGHKVVCLDLPGHGKNHPEDITKVHLADHVKYVEEELAKIEGKVILVAHSMTGMIISQVGEDMPEKIQSLVYFAAFLPEADGVAMSKYLMEDPWTYVGPVTTFTNEQGLSGFAPATARDLGFNTTSDKMMAFAGPRMQLENGAMWFEPVHITERFAALKKIYIHTLKDNCCSYYIQRVMCKRQPVVAEFYIDSDHCAMMEHYKETNEILLACANI